MYLSYFASITSNNGQETHKSKTNKKYSVYYSRFRCVVCEVVGPRQRDRQVLIHIREHLAMRFILYFRKHQ